MEYSDQIKKNFKVSSCSDVKELTDVGSGGGHNDKSLALK